MVERRHLVRRHGARRRRHRLLPFHGNLVQSALNGVYAAALFRYISHGETPPAFQGLPMAQAPGTEPVTT